MSIPVLGAPFRHPSSSMNDNVNNVFELCLRALFPPDFPCDERFGEEWVSTPFLFFSRAFLDSTFTREKKNKNHADGIVPR